MKIIPSILNQNLMRPIERILKIVPAWIGHCVCGAFLVCAVAASAQQEQRGLCAQVKIVILQELTLERIGFEATLEITDNDGNDPITDFFADLTFENPAFSTNNVVNDASSLFFVRAPQLDNISDVNGGGVIGPTKKAVIRWFIIPKIKAGGITPDGIRYKVGAKLSGKFQGKQLPADVLQALPDTIVVRPEPQLEITYFQPRDVQGDNPFTPEVESPVPFSIGVLVKNSGYGIAHKLKIASQQPQIVENKRHLLLVAQLLGSRVNDAPLNNANLTVVLGDLNPGEAKKASWDMITSLSGEFTDFKASFTHASDLGGEETSVIKSINAYFIAHEVLNDLPGRDKLLDFLADTDRDENMIPDALYESEGNVVPVNYLANTTIEALSGTPGAYRVNLDADRSGWGYMRLNDPGQNRLKIASIVRSDGKVINTHNMWTNTRYAKVTNARSDYLNLFDQVELKKYTYTVQYAPSSIDSTPPVTTLRFVGASGYSNGRYFITPDTQMYFTAEDQSPVSINYSLTNSAFLPAYPFVLRNPGEYALKYYAQDASGNREATHSTVLVVGNAGPSLMSFVGPGEPVIASGDALSVRPTTADIRYRAGFNPVPVDAYLDIFQGVLGWPVVSGVPSSPTASNTAHLVMGGDWVDFYKYSLDGGDWSAEKSVAEALDLANLAANQHAVRILGRSLYGTYGPETNAVAVQWTVDPAAPPTRITGAPASPTHDLFATLKVAGAGVNFYRWTLSNGYYRAPAGVTLSVVVTNLGPGLQNVAVIGLYQGAWQPTNNPTSIRWTVDPSYGSDYSSKPVVRSVTNLNIGILPRSFSWDGKNEQGTIMPPGWYTVRLTLKDGVGRSTYATKLVQLGEFAGAFNSLADAGRGPQNPHARGRWAVWQDQSSGISQIYAQDLLTPGFSPIRLATVNRSQEKPRTDGRYVVWQSRQINGGWDVWVQDLLSAAQPWALTSTADVDETNPSIDWPWVVYESKSSLDPKAPKQLKAMNLATGSGQTVSPSTQDELDPDVQADRVVWQDNRDVGFGEIYFKNLESGELRRLTTNAFGQYHPAMYDNWVVWQDNRNGQVDLYGFDFIRDTEVRITQTTENETHPFIDGPWCVCEEDSLGVSVANVRLIHLPTRFTVPITRTMTPKARPTLAARHVVWQDGVSGQNTIMSAELPSLQPVFQNQNIVAVTEALAANQHDARTLLSRWNTQAGVTEITRFVSLTPTVSFETARWVNGQFGGANFALEAGSFLWVKFDTNQVIDLGVTGRGFAALIAGVNAISYTAYPNDYTAYKMARQLGVNKVRAVRILESESGRWLVAEVRNGRLIGSDFAIPRAAVVFVDMDSPVAQWRPEP